MRPSRRAPGGPHRFSGLLCALGVGVTLLGCGAPANVGPADEDPAAGDSSGADTVVVAVDVTPGTMSLAVGDTGRFVATPRTASGDTVAGCAILWVSSDSTVAEVAQTGLATARAVGQAAVMAHCGAQSGQAGMSVSVAPTVPDTVFHDDFDSGALNDAGRWQDIYGNGWSIATAAAEGVTPHSGTRMLKIEPTGGAISHFVATGASSPYEHLRFSYWMYRRTGYASGGLRSGHIRGSKDQWASYGVGGSCADDPNNAHQQEFFIVALTQPLNIGWQLRMYNYWLGQQKQQESPPFCYGTYAMGPNDTPQGTYHDPTFASAEEQWYHYEIELQLNTPGVADGWEKVWVDGVLKIEHVGVMYRTSADTRIWAVTFDVGSTTVGTAYFDDVLVVVDAAP